METRTSPLDPYRELFERSADAILIIEGETFIDCNQAAVRLLRFASREEVLQTHPSELSPPTQPDGRDSFEKANEMIATAFREGSHRFEWDHLRADGEVFPVEVLLTAIAEPGRRVLHVVWRDITRRKHLEAQARQRSKMEAIGKLAGGIAHDFNNLLVAVLGNADLLREHIEGDAEAAGYLAEIQGAGERAADLVRQLLAFSRKQELRPVVLELGELLRETEGLLSRVIGEDVELSVRPCEEPLTVLADRGQLGQVLLNLATNARDALPAGGRVSLAVTPYAWQAPEGGEVPYARLVVRDDGAGMAPEVIERAFEPFFTTKERGEGTGLGLATVHGIVEQSQGCVRILSEAGRGTAVEVFLPLTTEPLAPRGGMAAGSRTLFGRGRLVLLAEDEPTIADVVRRHLEGAGFRVLVCADGLQALAAYGEHAAEIELVLSDVLMPGMGGPEFVEELRRQGHEPRVLFMSGYTDERLAGLRSGEFPPAFLAKPFNASTLRASLCEVLGE